MAFDPKVVPATTAAPAKNPNPSPRAKFLSSDENIVSHRKLLDSAVFQRSEDAAMQEYVRAIVALASTQDLSGAGAQQAAAASFHMISGAYQFIEVFHRLAEPYTPASKKQDPDNLDHTK